MKSFFKNKLRTGLLAIGITVVVIFIALGGSKAKQTPSQPPPLQVEVAQVEQKDVPIYSEWIGTLDGAVNAEIRAQVSGYLLRQTYKEGSFVKKGDLLFEIDPQPFQAALDQAKGDLAKAQAQVDQSNSQFMQTEAQLAQAQANQGKAQLDENRYVPLARDGVVPQQDMDNAVQANLAAKAQVKAAIAAVETARSAIGASKAAVAAAEGAAKTAELNLGFTRIYSPIDGIAGVAQAQVGNLIQPNNPNSPALTTISTVDPIKVYFTLSEQEYLNFTRRNLIQNKFEAKDGSELELVLSDGTVYPQKGRFSFADREVDQKTGALRLAGLFANTGNILRPGQYGRVRALINMKKDALLVPQRAVTELQGNYLVAVVGSDNKVDIRSVKVGDRIDSCWVIEGGLKQGEKVVVEGTQKVRTGAVVNPKLAAVSSASVQ